MTFFKKRNYNEYAVLSIPLLLIAQNLNRITSTQVRHKPHPTLSYCCLLVLVSRSTVSILIQIAFVSEEFQDVGPHWTTAWQLRNRLTARQRRYGNCLP